MNAAFVAAATAVCVGGVFTVLVGMRPAPDRPVRPNRWITRWRQVPNAWRIRAGLGLAGGLVVTLFTGFLPALLLLPAGIVMVPELLRNQAQPEVAMLEALDRWVRVVAASVATGKSVPDAIRATRQQTPALLNEPVKALLVRLDERWPLSDALQATADQLDSADADAVLAALILLGERGGVGASATLHTLSRSVQERLHALRDIAAERAKPQVVVRQVTAITLIALGGAAIIQPSYFEPYRSPLGQLLMMIMATVYLAAMGALRHIAGPRRRDRILVRVAHTDAALPVLGVRDG